MKATFVYMYRPLSGLWTMHCIALILIAGASPCLSTAVHAADIKLKKKAAVQVQDDTENEEDYGDIAATEPESGDNSSGDKNLQGFIEYENFTGTSLHQEARDMVKKNEFRNNITWRTGSERIYLSMDANIYGGTYSHDPVLYRNLTARASSFEINFNKLFFNAEFDLCRLRVGNQIYGWGTADVFNPTSYFNPMDMREALFKDQDELKQGVPSVSSLFFFGDDTLELVIVPVHVPVLLPESHTFWQIQYEEEGYPIHIEETRAMKIRPENIAVGLQYYKNIFSTDVNLSAYYGPDSEPLFRPLGTDVSIPNEPPAVRVVPEYHNTVKVGLSLSRGWNDFVFQGEVAYSPLKTGVEDQDYHDGQIPEFPFKTKTFHAMNSSVGFNYMIPMGKIIEGHEGDSVFTFEYSRPTYFSKSIMDPMLGDVLIMRLEDTFIYGRLKVMLTGIIDITEKGTIIMPEVQYRFPFGLSINAAYAFIEGGDRSLIGLYSDNDFVKVRIRYEYKI